MTIIVAAIVLAQAASPQVGRLNALEPYYDCVVRESVKLIPSGEPAASIVDAAQPLCDSLADAAAMEQANVIAADPVIARNATRFGWSAVQEARNIKPRVLDGARQIAISQVVRVKAAMAVGK